MPFVRGIIFSSRILDGCQALHDQLKVLAWGGLHLAVLKAKAEDAAPMAREPGELSSIPSYHDCEKLAVLELPYVDAPEGSTAWAAAADAAAASWAANCGLQWPVEVLVLGTLEDEAGALRLRQQQLLEGNADAGEVLPGFLLQSLGQAQELPWQRLRLALAQENLKRALAEARAQQLVGNAAVKDGHGSQNAGAEAPDPGSEGSRALPTAAASAPPLVVVGTVMKVSRERDLAREGLLNLVPQDGVVFAPLDLSMPLEQQLPFHAILHKASDELEYDENGTPRFGPRVRSLADFVSRHPEISLVDPLEAAAKVINRTELARVCDSLSFLDVTTPFLSNPGEGRQGSTGVGEEEDGGGSGFSEGNEDGDDGSTTSRAKRQRKETAPMDPAAGTYSGLRVGGRVRVRAPRSVTVSSFSREEMDGARQRLGCPPPYIVKPVIACGTPDSHSMALVMLPEALEGLQLPLPAVVQEFINHDATIIKVYVAGDKVFHTVRPSIPNVPRDRVEVQLLAPSGAVFFDSLKSLPTTLRPSAVQTGNGFCDPNPAAAAAPVAQPHVVVPPRAPSQAVLERLAAHLRVELGLSLFGFDVVVAAPDGDRSCGDGKGGDGDSGSVGGGSRPQPEGGRQEFVIVDINYFPSYRGAEGAAKLFRVAVLGAYLRQQQDRLHGRGATSA